MGFFSLRYHSQTGSGVHPALYPVGTGCFFQELKWPWREADISPPSNTEIKNAWSYTSALQYAFTALRLVKHRDNFTFTFMLTTRPYEWIFRSDCLHDMWRKQFDIRNCISCGFPFYLYSDIQDAAVTLLSPHPAT